MKPSCLVALLLGTAAPCQLIVVDPAGGGSYTDLQTAINAAPPGAVIHVIGGTYGPLQITRSLTIVGSNTPRIRAPVQGSGQQPPAITLQGTGSQTFVLSGCNVSGIADGWGVAGPGLRSLGFERIVIYDSIVRAHDWFQPTGAAASASGIVVDGLAALIVERSTVAASMSQVDANNVWSPSGASGIAAAAATVVLLDSTVNGGSAATVTWTFGAPTPAPCPCPSATGQGGAGVVAQVTYNSGATVVAGTGSAVFLGPPSVPSLTPWGNQLNGQPLVTPVSSTIATVLTQSAPLRLGATHSLAFAATTAPAFMAVGRPAVLPSPLLGFPFVFIDVTQPVSLPFVPVNSTSFSFTVPSSTTLIGVEIAEQRFDLTAFGSIVGTNPILAVVRP